MAPPRLLTLLPAPFAMCLVLLAAPAESKKAPVKRAVPKGVPQWELLAALKDLGKKNAFFSVFAERFYTAARFKLITLEGPATILIPSNVGNQLMKKKWDLYTPQQRLRILRNLIIRGKFSKNRLLSTVPLWQFRSMNMGLKLVKMNKRAQRECYFKAEGGKSFGPLNLPNMMATKNIQIHGVSMVPIPPNA
ncbi:hypothetical protein CLOM_g14087 [Closterium sp. NIES-68]|nr:hypothetical protein CLOM_g14087 [Closterium sp. NIES-68]